MQVLMGSNQSMRFKLRNKARSIPDPASLFGGEVAIIDCVLIVVFERGGDARCVRFSAWGRLVCTAARTPRTDR
jgi:hypothetical protein